MIFVTDDAPTPTWDSNASPLACQPQSEIEAALSAELPASWDVTRSVDPFGTISTVVFPADDTGTLPTFVLQDRQGFAEVGTVRNDVWVRDERFAGRADAVAAIVAGVLATGYRT